MLIVDPKDIPNIPNNQNKTYAKVVVAYWPPKENPYLIPITAGVNLITYPRDIMTETATITTVKPNWNSVLSTPIKQNTCVSTLPTSF